MSDSNDFTNIGRQNLAGQWDNDGGDETYDPDYHLDDDLLRSQGLKPWGVYTHEDERLDPPEQPAPAPRPQPQETGVFLPQLNDSHFWKSDTPGRFIGDRDKMPWANDPPQDNYGPNMPTALLETSTREDQASISHDNSSLLDTSFISSDQNLYRRGKQPQSASSYGSYAQHAGSGDSGRGYADSRWPTQSRPEAAESSFMAANQPTTLMVRSPEIDQSDFTDDGQFAGPSADPHGKSHRKARKDSRGKHKKYHKR